MARPGRSEHRLIIVRRDDRGSSILLVKERDAWILPRVDLPEERSADVAAVNRAVGTTLGLDTSVLRCLADGVGSDGGPRRHVHVVEAHGGSVPASAGARWMSQDAALGALASDPDAQALLDAWMRGADGSAAGGRELAWARAGWRDEALAWIAGELDRRGAAPVYRIEQLRLWEFSQVLALETAAGRFYFKARPSWGALEAPLTKRLAERHPASMPGVVAIDAVRHWMLMRATPGPDLMDVDDLSRWTDAAASIAAMQIDWVGSLDELAALGCPQGSLATLEADLGSLLDDTLLLKPDRADGLTDGEVDALRRRGRELAALCRELDGAGVPPSIEHGDLWAANVIAAETTNVFIDWEDASIAHPFFTPALLLLSLRYTDALRRVPDARRRLREAYLGPWAERGPLARWAPARLERAFDLAERVAMLHYAVQFKGSNAHIETSWEVRAFAPLFLRRALEEA